MSAVLEPNEMNTVWLNCILQLFRYFSTFLRSEVNNFHIHATVACNTRQVVKYGVCFIPLGATISEQFSYLPV